MSPTKICSILSSKTAVLGVVTLFVVASTSSARPQSVDNTAEAKQHYQNAVSAISRSDWQSAKSELL
jgi:outer membrane protein assembly factor BamD (BamD/ComL family)